MGGGESSCLMLEEFPDLETLAVVKSLGFGDRVGAWKCLEMPSVAVGPRASLSISGLWCSCSVRKDPPCGVVVKIKTSLKSTGKVLNKSLEGGVCSG